MHNQNTETAPVRPEVAASGGCRSNPANREAREVYPMMSHPSANALPADQTETWRDLADQLTPEQIAYMEKAEQHPVVKADGSTFDAETQRGSLLFGAREFIQENTAAERFRHVQAPTCADQVDVWWPGDDDASWSRAWWGTTRVTEIAAASGPFTVMLTGTQWSDGRGQTGIAVGADDSPMTAAEARRLAAALAEVADELDALDGRTGVAG